MTRPRPHRAFTLLETLLALGLTVALSAGIFTFLFSLAARSAGAAAHTASRHGMSTVLAKMSRDLACTVADDAALGAGVRGDAVSVRVLTRGVDLDAAIRGGREGAGDLLVSEYRFDQPTGSVLASCRVVGPGGGAAEAVLERACSGVRRLRLRYFDGRSWVDSFDSVQAGRLPGAVEIGVWLGAPRADDADRRDAPDEVLVVAIPDAGGAAL